jgi:hypothetical protein
MGLIGPQDDEPMRPISYPLMFDQQDREVANLQRGLLFLIEHEVIALSESDRLLMIEALANEQGKTLFGRITARIVSIFRSQHGLQPGSEIDQATAEALNRVLVELGAISPPTPQLRRLVSGVVCRENGQLLQGSLVRAIHEVEASVISLGDGTTDAEGRYTIRYGLPTGVDTIHLRVVVLGADGSRLFGSNLIQEAKAEETVDLILPNVESLPDKPGNETMTTIIVRGGVHEADGTPFAGGTVHAYHRGLRAEDLLLGQTTTDRRGNYEIQYTSAPLRRLGREAPNLFVRAYDAENNLIASSENEIVFNAPTETTRDLIIDPAKYRKPAEHTRLIRDVSAILRDTRLADLSNSEVNLVAGESGQDRERVQLAAQSAKLADDTGLQAEVIYALGRQGLPVTSLQALMSCKPSGLRLALERAVAQNEIPTLQPSDVQGLVERFQSLATDEALRGELGSLLRTSPPLAPDADRQQKFVKAFLKYEGPVDAFWESLGDDRDFTDTAVVQELKMTMDLGTLARNHLPMVQLLQGELRREEAPKDLRALAAWTSDEWESAVQLAGVPPETVGKDEVEKARNYAETLFRAVEASFPTAVVAHRLRREDEQVPDSQALLDLFHQNNAFELATADIDRDLGAGVDPATKNAVKSWQRVFRVAPAHGRYDVMKILKTSGLDSAQSIVSMRRSAFLEQHADKLGIKPAEEVWENASRINGLTLMLLTNLSPDFNNDMPKAIPQPISTLPAESEGIATLQELFGSMDFCECEHCKSVYSAAAYFVDLLEFLKDGTKNKMGLAPLAVLLSRRPDLVEIELSCENTNTRMPYVDLVNEVLENAATRFELVNFGVGNLEDVAALKNPSGDPHFVSLLRKFSEAGYPLSEHCKLSSVEKDRRWAVIDGEKKYTILIERGQLYVYALLNHQTRSREDELSAQPEYLNTGAYLKLAQAVHPWNLPFDLWWEEARIYMKHLGFERYQWMEKLLPGLSDEARRLMVAYDHLGITMPEYDLITDTTGLNEPKLWGLEPTSGIDRLCDVKLLLRQAGLESKIPGESFKTIRQLIYTRFIDPENALDIHFENDPCDLEKATLISKNGAQTDWTTIFNRMRRFLRLHRKIGFTIFELDKAITTLSRQPTWTGLIQRLSNLERLRADLNVPRLELMSWWGNIDTAEDESEEEESKKAPSLYEKVFLNRSVDNPANALFELDLSRIELKAAAQHFKISDKAPTVASALEVSISNLKRLIKGQNLAEEGFIADELNLKNLSFLYRIVSISKALKLTIKDFLSARVIIGIDPFADTPGKLGQAAQDRTVNAREFVRQVRDFQASAFSISELDYLLRHRYEEATDLFVPADAEIARALAEISNGLAKIASDSVVAPDPEGALTGKRLGLLVEPSVVEEVLHLLRWEKTTIVLPPGVELTLPQSLKKKVIYDKTAGKLTVNGPLTEDEKAALLNLSNDATYTDEIKKLYDEPRTFLEQKLREKLKALSWLADALKTVLDQKSEQQDRFSAILEAVNQYLCQTLSENLVKERLAGTLSLDADITALLLEKLVKAQIDQTKPALADFLALAVPGLTEEKPVNNVRIKRGMLQAERSGAYTFHAQPGINIKLLVNDRAIEPNSFIDLEAGKFYSLQLEYSAGQQPVVFWQPPSAPDHIIPTNRLVPASAMASYRLLHKCSLLLRKLRIRADELSYLAAHGSDFEQFDVNGFPLTPSETAPLYEQWQHLHKVFTFRDRYSQAKTRLIDVFSAAQQSIAAAKERLLALTGWDKTDFEDLSGSQGFGLSAEDLKSGGKLDKLHEAFVILKRLGVSAQQLLDWVGTDLGADSVTLEKKEATVQSLKQAVKAKYDAVQWLKVGRPLRDELREKQRIALVAFLVHDIGLKDTNELYERYLIDVEMSPCMMTSRIVQAVSSVQLFVQRCLMGLEPDVHFSPEMANEWKWRKNYRVWEANRKVFLYPENWIEPELRDDKSPLFQDLENELLQDEITDEKVEKAFLSYLLKLDEVSRLEIVGMYEQTDGWFETSNKSTQAYVLHVLGRTYGIPHVYYYRRWIDKSYWTPWERIDLDIEGDHLIPVVWNRRLHLFWPIFSEKSEEPKNVTQSTDTTYTTDKDGKLTGSTTNSAPSNPPEKRWDIQLAWSEYQNGKWATKTVGPHLLEIKDHALKKLYHFRACRSENLSIQCWKYNNQSIPWDNEMKGEFVFQECRGLPEPTDIKSGVREPLQLKWSEPEYMMYIGINAFSNPGIVPYTLGRAASVYQVIIPHQYSSLSPLSPLFYQDSTRTFFIHVLTIVQDALAWFITGLPWRPLILFDMFYHPYSCDFFKYLNQYGLKGLLDPEPTNTEAYTARRQLAHAGGKEFFSNEYAPFPLVVQTPYPSKDVEFSHGGAYSLYNWEIFFHAPLFIADRLSKNQRFEEAMKWFHYIFNPLETADGYPPERFWKVRPFYEMYREKDGLPKRIQELMVLLNQGDSAMEQQVAEWRKNPFKPHVIARLRLPAYMKTVVMKYIDNLIAWGDQLFRQYTMESVNEATQLYILAAQILGPCPEQVPATKGAKRANLTYRELEAKKIDTFSNVLIELEHLLKGPDGGTQSFSKVPVMIEGPPSISGTSNVTIIGQEEETLTLNTLFFCIPHNENLLKYWDTVEDRLFKIRHCMTIEGRVQELPLFQPPIDPALLVRAAAAGIDIASVLSDLSAPLPHYRFQVMAQKATELCAEVRSLGAALLSALEKKDAEELSLMRSKHECQILKTVRDVKKQQIEETAAVHQGLLKTKELVQQRQKHYTDLINKGLNASEKSHLESLGIAATLQLVGQMLEMAASNASGSPDMITGSAGWAGTPVVSAKFGGSNVASALAFQGRYMAMMASVISTFGTMASIEGGFQRREQEWKLQEGSARKELEQIEKQLVAAEIRMAIAEKELKNHEKQIDNANEVDAYLKSKYTNKELYNWMISQLSTLYFGSYQLAYDLARRAEMAYRHELGLPGSDFIKFGYWDSLKKGLLAGERLHFDLKRMEIAYLEQNRREYEITKHVSLALVDPTQLLRLKQTGECYLNLPEVIFDLDFPGHYMRRIKSVSLTVPCVTGPYTGVNCTLTLLKSSVRHRNALLGGAHKRDPVNEDRFTDNLGAVQSIVTSSGQNDSGLFETNLRDERYLPFEGIGAISEWRIELSREFPQFDYNTISDVVLHLRYTAREGGSPLKQAATHELTETLNELIRSEGEKGLVQVFSLRQQFTDAFFKLLNPPPNSDQKTEFVVKGQHFPYILAIRRLNVSDVTVYLKPKEKEAINTDPPTFKLNDIDVSDNKWSMFADTNLKVGRFSVSGDPIKTWTINAGKDSLKKEEVDDIFILLKYKISQ